MLSDRSIKVKELIGDQVGMGTYGLVELELKEFDKRIKELEARIAMLNKYIDANESNHDYAIATDTVRIFLNDPIEDFKDLKL